MLINKLMHRDKLRQAGVPAKSRNHPKLNGGYFFTENSQLFIVQLTDD